MGQVWRALDLLTGVPVAVKILPFGDRASPQALERFRREADALARLSHPNVVRYVAHGTTAAGGRFLAMDWLEGHDLAQELTKGGLTVRETVELGIAAARALGAANAVGLVHRDVKPSNLFLRAGKISDLVLIDLGVARLVGPERITKTGAALGTPGFIAPEQARGDPVIDARADVFSLACVLFECATGHAAFPGDEIVAILAKVLFTDAPRARSLNPRVPEALDEILARCLSRDPALRPADGNALADELERLPLVSGDSIRPPPPSLQPPALTDAEQRLVSVVVASGGSVSEAAEASTAATLTPQQALGEKSEAWVVAARFGARAERLADGTIIFVLGARGSAGDRARAAARCALALREVLGPVTLAVATGRGIVEAGPPIGDAVERAAKLLAASPAAGRILIDPVARGLLGDAFHVVDRGGRAELMAERERGIATVLGRPTPFVGRERELFALEALLDEVVEQSVARGVLIEAPAGFGKTRLRQELVRRMAQRVPAPAIWLGAGEAVDAGAPFAVIGRALAGAAGIAKGQRPEERRARLEQLVGEWVDPDDARDVAEFAGEIVGVRFAAEQSERLRAARRDPRLMHEQIQRAFRRLVEARARRAPLLILLEDLHWGDPPSLELVDAVLRDLSRTALLVVGMGRPELREAFPNLWVTRGVERLHLKGLAPRALERLARTILPDLDDERVARLVERADGNPLLLEELLRAAIDHRDSDTPETVLAMLHARLESLPDALRRALRAASVFGRTFWASAVAELLAVTSAEVEALVAELVDRELLVEDERSRVDGERQFSFRNALARDAAYGTLIDADRELGHRLAAAWLERLGDEEPALLAEHYERAGQHAEAARAYLRAAELSLAAGDLEAAERWSHVGERAAMHAGSGPELLGALHAVRAEVLEWRGEHAEAARVAREAAACMSPGTDRYFRLAGTLAEALGRQGATAEVEALLAEIESAPEVLPAAAGARVVATAKAAALLLFAGRIDVARRWLGAVAIGGPGPGDPIAEAWIARVRAIHERLSGDPAASARSFLSAATAFENGGDRSSAHRERINAADCYIELGAYEVAGELLARLVDETDRDGLLPLAAIARHNLARARAALGEPREAIELQRAAAAAFERAGDPRLLGGARLGIAVALAALGDPDAAETEARAAIALLETAPPTRATALAELARILLRVGRKVEALEIAAEAARVLEQLGGVEVGESTIHLVHADALLTAGRDEDARRVLGEARRRLLARADGIGELSDRQRFLTAVADNARTLELAECARVGIEPAFA